MNGTSLVKREPVAISVAFGTVVASAVALAALLWPERLTPELQAAIIVLANSSIALVVALFARDNSTPVAAPTLPAGTTVTVETAEGQPNVTATLPEG